MLTLHHLENSQSLRVLWLLEELGADYEFKFYKRDAKTSLAPASYKALHPAGTAPVISNGSFVLAETNAIVDYLLDQHPESRLRPAPDSAAYPLYLYWFHASQGSLMPLLLDTLIFQRMVEKSPFLVRPILRAATEQVQNIFHRPRLRALLTQANNQLGETNWLTSDELSAADIVMGYCFEVLSMRTETEHDYPHIARFVTQMRERSAYQEAVTKGGPLRPFGE
ncbi:MAG: glutathione S-transferase [Gammaproteobacteria bacterium]|nr:MAG: glutathione S-transferase [Gammaproteobacteria bacterium]